MDLSDNLYADSGENELRDSTSEQLNSRKSVARLFAAGTDEWLINSLAIVALFVGLVGDEAKLAFIVGVLALIITALFRIPLVSGQSRLWGLTGKLIVGRVVLVILSASVFAEELSGHNWLNEWLAPTILAVTIVSEELLNRVLNAAHPFMANHPPVRVRNFSLFHVGYVFWINLGGVASFGLLATFKAPISWTFALVALIAIPSLILLIDGVKRFCSVRQKSAELPEILNELAPEFVVYWDASSGTEFQLEMWLPQLELIDRRFIVILRNSGTFERIAAMTTAPVLYRRRSIDLDDVIVPTLKVAFYVNNAMRNSHFVRYPQLTHVQLNHGDSDKAPSFNPVTRMFDRNFVAGQAAIDRFAANDVQISPTLCQIVGRPQVAGIQVGPRVRESSDDGQIVLYAPTWRGHHLDSNYSSLEIGEAIVLGLLNRGCTVIFRPHPYTDRDVVHARESAKIRDILAEDSEVSGRLHVYSENICEDSTLIQNFNESDYLVSDISSVIPDFLFSEKPFAMSVMDRTAEECYEQLPVSRAAHLFGTDLSSLEASLDALIGEDLLRQERIAMKGYYLGEFPEEEYSHVFRNAVINLLDSAEQNS